MARRWLPLPALLTLVTGCSGTPFGDQLARSFSEPPPPAAAPPAQPAVAPGQLDQTRPDQAGADQPKPGPTKPDQTKPRPAARQSAAAPAPYRITLRLPGADPAAPAEAVTEALRAAGVSFEVEMIERVRSDGTPAAPSSAPAPPPR